MARLDERFAGFEDSRSEHDRRFAELGGSVQAFAGELQSLVKRMSSMDMRLGESQLSFEDAGRAQVDKFQQDLQNTAQNMMILKEDLLRRVDDRVAKLQSMVDGVGESQVRHGRRMDVAEAQLEQLVDSLEAHKKAKAAEASKPPVPPLPALPPAELVRLEQGAMEAKQAAGQAASVAKDLAAEVHYMQVRLEEHELRLSAFASKMQSQGQQLQGLGDLVGQVAQTAERAAEQAGQLAAERAASERAAAERAVAERAAAERVAAERSEEHSPAPPSPESTKGLADGQRRAGAEESLVDRKINALEEKLAAGSGKASVPPSPAPTPSRECQADERREPAPVEPEEPPAAAQEPEQSAASASAGATVRELRAEVEVLGSRVAAHEKALEDLCSHLAFVQGRLEQSGAASESGGSAGAGTALRAVAAELHSLTECLASNEAASRALLPRLAAAAAQQVGEVNGMEVATLGEAGRQGKEERKASRQARGRQGPASGCWRWLT